MSTNTSWQTPSWLKSSQSRSKFSQLWQVPVFLVGVFALVVVCGGAVMRHSQQSLDYQERLAEIRQALNQPEPDIAALLSRTEHLVEQASYHPNQAGEAHFLMGTLLLRQAEGESAAQAKATHQQVLYHLQQAESIGIKEENQPRLWYSLGFVLLQTEGNPKQAIDYLTRGLPSGTDNPVQGYGLLVEANLKLPSPNLEGALQANEKQIKATSEEAVLIPARLLRGELLVRTKQNLEALKVLERIPPTAPAPIWEKSLYLQAVCCQAEGLWTKAAPLWEALVRTPDTVPGGRKRILYNLGKAYINSQPRAEGKAVGAWQKAQQEGGEEGQAAALHLAEVFLLGSKLDFGRATQFLQSAFASVSSDKEYKNSLVSLETARDLVGLAITLGQENRFYEQAQDLIDVYRKLGGPGVTDIRLAEINEAWAQDLEEQAQHADSSEVKALKQQAQVQWLRAAEAYQQAAEDKFSSEKKADLLWQSIQCFRSGNEEGKAEQLLGKYLELPLNDEDQAKGWFTRAESLRAQGKKEKANEAYYKCWEFSGSSYSYRARYQLALDKIEAKQLQEAESILWQNLKIQGPNLDREAHEKSLYLLSTMLYQRGDFSQAYLWLQEALRRYPDNAEVFAIRDYLADCFWQLGKQIQRKLLEQPNNLPATALAQMRKMRMEWLEKANLTYTQLADELKLLKTRQSLSSQQEKLFRKATFSKADLELDMNNYSEALRGYKKLADSYRGQIEELVAFQRMWLCYNALKFQPKDQEMAAEAMQETLPSIRSTLATLPDNAFQEPWTRSVFQALQKQVESQLPKSSPSFSPLNP